MILLDTGPLVALCDRQDAKNSLARRHLKKFAAETFATCDAVLAEACFHLPHKFERQRLRALVDELDVTQMAECSLPVFRETAFDWLIKYADHEPDWADACLAVLSERHPDAQIWTYDSAFRTTWRRPNGRAISLAVR